MLLVSLAATVQRDEVVVNSGERLCRENLVKVLHYLAHEVHGLRQVCKYIEYVQVVVWVIRYLVMKPQPSRDALCQYRVIVEQPLLRVTFAITLGPPVLREEVVPPNNAWTVLQLN